MSINRMIGFSALLEYVSSGLKIEIRSSFVRLCRYYLYALLCWGISFEFTVAASPRIFEKTNFPTLRICFAFDNMGPCGSKKKNKRFTSPTSLSRTFSNFSWIFSGEAKNLNYLENERSWSKIEWYLYDSWAVILYGDLWNCSVQGHFGVIRCTYDFCKIRFSYSFYTYNCFTAKRFACVKS